MSALLDTHVFVWWVTSSTRLSEAHRQLFADRDEPVFVSAVTAWEIAITVKFGKWTEAAALLPDIAGLIERSGLQQLHLTTAQAERAGSLELVHRDPFDRMLAAQALDLDIPLATVDPDLAKLGCKIV